MTLAIERREGSKIGQNCHGIVLKNWRHRGGGLKNPEILPTSFLDGPKKYHMHEILVEINISS